MEELENIKEDTPPGTPVLLVRCDKIFKTKTTSIPKSFGGTKSFPSSKIFFVKVEGIPRNFPIHEVWLIPAPT